MNAPSKFTFVENPKADIINAITDSEGYDGWMDGGLPVDSALNHQLVVEITHDPERQDVHTVCGERAK